MGLTSSRGNRPARLHSSMMGMRLSSMNLRAVSRTRRSSSVSRVSKAMKSTPRNFRAMGNSILFPLRLVWLGHSRPSGRRQTGSVYYSGQLADKIVRPAQTDRETLDGDDRNLVLLCACWLRTVVHRGPQDSPLGESFASMSVMAIYHQRSPQFSIFQPFSLP